MPEDKIMNETNEIREEDRLPWVDVAPVCDGVYKWKKSFDVKGPLEECWCRIINGKLYDLDLTDGKRIIRDGDTVAFGGLWKGPFETLCWPLAK